MQPYKPRTIRFDGLRRIGSWSLKCYSVACDDRPIDRPRFESGIDQVGQQLPPPDPAAGRPGFGLLIAHQGMTGDYLVLGWWDHENELPLSIWVRRAGDDRWRAAERGESVCVWDLEIIWAERNAWIETMLTPSSSDSAAYLQRIAEKYCS